MCEGNLDILAHDVDDGVEFRHGHVVLQQVLQSVAALDAPSVVHDGEPRVQIGVVAKHRLHKLLVELVVLEQRVVGTEVDVGSVLVLRVAGLVADELAFLEDEGSHFSLAVALHLEAGTEGVDGLHAHAVESYALLEGLGVVFSARVEHAHGLHELSLRDSAAVVAHAHGLVVFNVYLNPVAGVHLELIDTVVDDLLEQHVDSVFGQRAVAESADIHARSGAHVLHVGEVADVVVGIGRRQFLLIVNVRSVVGHY